MGRFYILDTNVLLHDPKAIQKFDEHEVVIPIYAIEEVDQFKREMSDRGRAARQVARYLDELREQNGNSLQTGVMLENGGRLRVAVLSARDQRPRDSADMDRAIMTVALEIRDANPDDMVVFVTMDTNLRIRADALGLRAETYEGGQIAKDSSLYSGVLELQVSSDQVDALGQRKPVELDGGNLEILKDEYANACVVVRSEEKPNHTALGRWDVSQKSIVPLISPRDGAWGIRPRNLEQRFAMDLLLSPHIDLVTVVGKAGTGKTLLTIAAGLRLVIDEGNHGRLRVSRPIFPLGKDLGYLPGTLEEKLNPWMQPIYDNLEYIFSTGRSPRDTGRNWTELVAAGTIQVEPLTYIRGRSLPNQFLVVDEAQNLTPHEVKTIVTRCGQGTKIVLTGDPDQIDNPYVDASSNGLTYVAERFKHESIAGHVTLLKGERSVLAERATELL